MEGGPTPLGWTAPCPSASSNDSQRGGARPDSNAARKARAFVRAAPDRPICHRSPAASIQSNQVPGIDGIAWRVPSASRRTSCPRCSNQAWLASDASSASTSPCRSTSRQPQGPTRATPLPLASQTPPSPASCIPNMIAPSPSSGRGMREIVRPSRISRTSDRLNTHNPPSWPIASDITPTSPGSFSTRPPRNRHSPPSPPNHSVSKGCQARLRSMSPHGVSTRRTSRNPFTCTRPLP